MSAKLLCRTGPQAGLTFRIRDVARIGRGSGIEVDLPLQGVSSLHATIVYTAGSYWIEDAGSTNGTFVNGRRVQKERLRHLDVLSLGASVDLLFVLKTVVAGEEPSVMLGPSLSAARLIAMDGPDTGTAREVPKGVLTVGRATACNLVIDSAAVSKMHARLERMGDLLTVVDLGSANGTFVNGVKVSAAPLANGDRLVFAAVREFRVEIEMATGGGQATVSLPRSLAAGDSPSGVGQDWRTRYDFSPGENAPEEKGGMGATVSRPAISGSSARPKPASAAAPPRATPPVAKSAPAAPPPVPKAPPAPKPPSVEKAPEAPKPAEVPKPVEAAKAAAPAAPPVTPRPPAVAAPPLAPVPAPSAPAAEAKPAPPAPPVPARPAPPVTPAAPVAPSPMTVAGSEEDREGLTERISHISQVVLESPTGTYRVGPGSHYVGRHVTCAISIQETKISRLHATITVTANEVILKDLQSANGTFLNGERISEPKALKTGDTIIFAEAPFKVNFEY